MKKYKNEVQKEQTVDKEVAIAAGHKALDTRATLNARPPLVRTVGDRLPLSMGASWRSRSTTLAFTPTQDASSGKQRLGGGHCNAEDRECLMNCSLSGTSTSCSVCLNYSFDACARTQEGIACAYNPCIRISISYNHNSE